MVLQPWCCSSWAFTAVAPCSRSAQGLTPPSPARGLPRNEPALAWSIPHRQRSPHSRKGHDHDVRNSLKPASSSPPTRALPERKREYRKARNGLVAEEIELRRQLERVRAQRRALPPRRIGTTVRRRRPRHRSARRAARGAARPHARAGGANSISSGEARPCAPCGTPRLSFGKGARWVVSWMAGFEAVGGRHGRGPFREWW